MVLVLLMGVIIVTTKKGGEWSYEGECECERNIGVESEV